MSPTANKKRKPKARRTAKAQAKDFLKLEDQLLGLKKPKRFLPVFIIFARERRPAIQMRHPGWTARDVQKHLALLWHALPPASKARYQSEVDKDRDRYDNEMAEYSYRRAQLLLRRSAEGRGPIADDEDLAPRKRAISTTSPPASPSNKRHARDGLRGPDGAPSSPQAVSSSTSAASSSPRASLSAQAIASSLLELGAGYLAPAAAATISGYNGDAAVAATRPSSAAELASPVSPGMDRRREQELLHTTPSPYAVLTNPFATSGFTALPPPRLGDVDLPRQGFFPFEHPGETRLPRHAQASFPYISSRFAPLSEKARPKGAAKASASETASWVSPAFDSAARSTSSMDAALLESRRGLLASHMAAPAAYLPSQRLRSPLHAHLPASLFRNGKTPQDPQGRRRVQRDEMEDPYAFLASMPSRAPVSAGHLWSGVRSAPQADFTAVGDFPPSVQLPPAPPRRRALSGLPPPVPKSQLQSSVMGMPGLVGLIPGLRAPLPMDAYSRDFFRLTSDQAWDPQLAAAQLHMDLKRWRAEEDGMDDEVVTIL